MGLVTQMRIRQQAIDETKRRCHTSWLSGRLDSVLLTEEEANLFAAALLMPQQTVERIYRPTESQPNRFGRVCEIFSASGVVFSRVCRR